MTAETRVSEGKCVLVGLQIDSNGRDVLSWALGKVAKKGDCVVAVHVCRHPDLRRESSMPPLITVLDDYLEVYEGFCSLKQILLVGRISRGRSIRKALVKEAEICAAMTVVVGATNNYSFGVSTSLAKYCARKLPPTTALIAVHNGRIIFEKGSAMLTQGREQKLILRNILHPSVRVDRKAIAPSLSDVGSPRSSDVSYADSLMGGVSNNSSSISNLVRSLPERPGWPLLRRAVPENLDALKDGEARKMSVVQWVMKLPNRSSSSIPSQLHIDDAHPLLELSKELERILSANCSSSKWFQYEELLLSTRQFSSENLIGKGGSSQVYKGCLSGGQQVAIKLSKLSEVASRDFIMEVDIITRLQHEHIVSLLGICVSNKQLISVYGYFSKGSLEDNLCGTKSKSPLPWDIRFKVATGVAEALSYLHYGCSQPVIHRDVKSSNILLSDDFKPQLSDFGLALWAPTTQPHLTHSDVFGTFGYLAPEYFMYGKVSDKIDVYAFGVVLLELITGKKSISDENPKGHESLVMWATRKLERWDIMELLDPNLEAKYDEDQLRRMALAASLCITRAAHLRPSISHILSVLRGEDGTKAMMNSCVIKSLNDQDEEDYQVTKIGSHLSLALLDVDDDASVTSFEQNHIKSMEEYLQGRYSRSSSFD